MALQRFECLIRKPSSFRFLSDIFIIDGDGKIRRSRIHRRNSSFFDISFEFEENESPWMMLFGDNRALLYRLSLTGGVVSFAEKGSFDGTMLCLGNSCAFQGCQDVPDQVIECVCDFFCV